MFTITATSQTERKSVVVIGGGVAGIAASVTLAESGFKPMLLEKRPLLGGRASSATDPHTGERIDECQHGTMRCCTELTSLLAQLGVDDKIEYFDTLEFLDGQGRRSVIKGSHFPAPLHTALSFLTFRSLGLKDKLGIARGMLCMLRAHSDERNEELAFGEWLSKTGQTELAIRHFWRPILISSCNEEPERIACSFAFKIFVEGFLSTANGYHFGVPTVPLATLYTEPTISYLHRNGGCVRTRATVSKLHFSAGRITGLELTGGEYVQADYIISSLQSDMLLKMIPKEVQIHSDYWSKLSEFELVPLLGAHLWFEGKIEAPPALAILDREIEWIFNRSRNLKLPSDKETCLSVVISASRRYAQLDKNSLVEQIVSEARACLPQLNSSKLLRTYLVRWPKATFSPKPGVNGIRPVQRSPIPNLFVAGEWTRTEWPSTMEGAARSGRLAASFLLEEEGIERRKPPADPPAAPLVRFIYRFKIPV